MSMALLDRARARRWQPPPAPKSPMEFARTMILPDGPTPDQKWNPDTEPMQAAWVREMANPQWRYMIAVAPSQRGKSLMGTALPIEYHITQLQQDVAFAMPNLEKLEQTWHGKLKPLIIDSGFGEWLPKKGPGSEGGKPAVLMLTDPAGELRPKRLYFMAASGGGKETSKASNTVQAVVLDEADDLDHVGEVKLLSRRMRSFGKRIRYYIVSTVNDRKGRPGHPILTLYGQASQARLWYPCPACGRYQPMEWEQFQCDDELIGYHCIHCPALWTEEDRQQALSKWELVHPGQQVTDAGMVVGPKPAGSWFSLICWDVEFTRASMEEIAEEWRMASRLITEAGDHSLMKDFYRKVLNRDYTGDVEALETATELTWQSLLKRSQASKDWGPTIHTTDRRVEDDGHLYSRHVAPAPIGAHFAVGGVDVQGDRVYPVLAGYALDGTSWDIAWSYEMARVDRQGWNKAELFQLLERVHLNFHAWAQGIPLIGIALDTGDFTADLMDWIAPHRPLWLPIKGQKTLAPPKVPDQDDVEGIIHVREGLGHIHNGNTRNQIHTALRRNPTHPGAQLLPSGLGNNQSDTTYLRHVLGEIQVVDPKTGKLKVVEKGRWDLLDARRYAHAIAQRHFRMLARLAKAKEDAEKGQSTRGVVESGGDWGSAMRDW